MGCLTRKGATQVILSTKSAKTSWGKRFIAALSATGMATAFTFALNSTPGFAEKDESSPRAKKSERTLKQNRQEKRSLERLAENKCQPASHYCSNMKKTCRSNGEYTPQVRSVCERKKQQCQNTTALNTVAQRDCKQVLKGCDIVKAQWEGQKKACVNADHYCQEQWAMCTGIDSDWQDPSVNGLALSYISK